MRETVAAYKTGWMRLCSEVMGINRRNLELIYPHNPRQNFPNVDDKIICKRLLEQGGISVPKTLALFDTQLSLRQGKKLLENLEQFALKPNAGSGGLGVVLIKEKKSSHFLCHDGQLLSAEDLFWHIQNIIAGVFSLDNLTDVAIIEELLEPDEDLAKLSYKGVPDVRIIVLKDKPVMAMLRLPTSKSKGKANLHQGALGVGVDLETGVTTNSIYQGEFNTHHPDTGMGLIGVQIPEWDPILEQSSKIPALVGLNYVGIDFVIDRRSGLKVLEVNARPGLQIQLANFKGLRPVVQEAV